MESLKMLKSQRNESVPISKNRASLSPNHLSLLGILKIAVFLKKPNLFLRKHFTNASLFAIIYWLILNCTP
jgi:hypothetical protein